MVGEVVSIAVLGVCGVGLVVLVGGVGVEGVVIVAVIVGIGSVVVRLRRRCWRLCAKFIFSGLEKVLAIH